MANRRLIRSVFLLMLCFCCSCISSTRYTYDGVQAEYGRASLAEVEKQKDPQGSEPYRVSHGNGPLTLDKAIGIASENNPDLIQASGRIEQSRAMLKLAEAAFWPRLSTYTEYLQGDSPSAFLFKTIDQRMLPFNVDFNDPGWFQNFESGLNGRVNLFNGFKDHLGARMAEKDLNISRMRRSQVFNELTAEVIQSFYDALAAEDFVRIAEASVDTVAEQLRIMRIRYEGGAVVKSDVLSLEVRLAKAREQLVASKNRRKLARAALANLMGLDPSVLAEREMVFESAEPVPPGIPDDYETGVAAALANRPELIQARQQVVKTRMGLAAARAGYLPRLDFVAKYYVDDPHMDYDLDRENWTAALVLNWDLFTGFSRSAQVNRAQALLQQMLAADRKAVLNIKLDVKNAYLNMEEARARYEVARSSVESAEESFRLVREHYQGGAVTVTRFLEAEFDRNHARLRSRSAYYGQIKAGAEVARAIGLWARKQFPTQE